MRQSLGRNDRTSQAVKVNSASLFSEAQSGTRERQDNKPVVSEEIRERNPKAA